MKHIDELVQDLGSHGVLTSIDEIREKTANTIGVDNHPMAIVYPNNTEQVQKLVQFANKHKIALYPVSRGRNRGYGDRMPVTDNNIVVDLQRMDKITAIDKRHGFVWLQPGVTQAQLAEILTGTGYWMDVTGAGLDASIMGNTLDGGFGWSPKGNRRLNISDVEAVLGNGQVLNTGTLPQRGPDLAPLFIQSNLGIVTSMRQELVPKPEHSESYMIGVKDYSGIEKLVDTLSELRKDDVITSVVHISNPLRHIVSTTTVPLGYENKKLTNESALLELNKGPVKFGYWSAFGSIHGRKSMAKARRMEIKKAFKGIAECSFMSQSDIYYYGALVDTAKILLPKKMAPYEKMLGQYEMIHGVMTGKPTDVGIQNIKWRVEDEKNAGLLWYAPSTEASGRKVRELYDTASEIYNMHGFEMPITVSLITHDRVVCVTNIAYDKTKDQEKSRAFNLYEELNSSLAKKGIHPYRSSIIGMDFEYQDKGKQEFLVSLKKTFDPNNIIAPGRYLLNT